MKFHLFLALSVIAPFGVLANVGDTVCVEGYPMDYYCIKEGFLVDNPTVVSLEGPNVHSVHCMIDVPDCIASPFEILTKPTDGGKVHTRAYRLDDMTKTALVDLAKTVGICRDCAAGGTIKTGLMVAVQGEVVALAVGDIPPIISGTVKLSSLASPGCSAPVPAGSPAGTAPAPAGSPTGTATSTLSTFDY
jgi:hypothetical protein